MASPEEREGETYTQQLKVKLERLHSVKLTHHDHTIKLLDMQMLQVVKDT
jgi:hypothetical protein